MTFKKFNSNMSTTVSTLLLKTVFIGLEITPLESVDALDKKNQKFLHAGYQGEYKCFFNCFLNVIVILLFYFP